MFDNVSHSCKHILTIFFCHSFPKLKVLVKSWSQEYKMITKTFPLILIMNRPIANRRQPLFCILKVNLTCSFFSSFTLLPHPVLFPFVYSSILSIDSSVWRKRWIGLKERKIFEDITLESKFMIHWILFSWLAFQS